MKYAWKPWDWLVLLQLKFQIYNDSKYVPLATLLKNFKKCAHVSIYVQVHIECANEHTHWLDCGIACICHWWDIHPRPWDLSCSSDAVHLQGNSNSNCKPCSQWQCSFHLKAALPLATSLWQCHVTLVGRDPGSHVVMDVNKWKHELFKTVSVGHEFF